MIQTIHTPQYSFESRITGDPNNPLVVLLHGFPESSIMYEELMEDLSSAGYYCIAPNLRGYSPGARPKGKRHYTLDNLTQDILDIVGTTGKEKFHLIGHDWGAVIGWKLVYDHPDKIHSWTALSIPHIQSFFNAVMHDEKQKRKSKYIQLFQWPFLPEWKIRSNHFELFRKLWNVHDQNEIQDYLNISRQKRALTSMLNYYRANYNIIKKAGISQILGNITVPTLFIWGNKDIAIGKKAVDGNHQYIKGPYTFIELNAGHWLIQEKYEEIKAAIEKLLSTKIT